MKTDKLIRIFLQFDKPHDRVDLQRLAAHILTFAAAIWWAVLSAEGFGQCFSRFAAMLIFAMVVRLLLSRAGASRLAALVVLVGALGVMQSLSVQEVMLLGVVALTVLLAQEYFILRTKLVACGAAVVLGAFAAGSGMYADRIFLVFAAALVARLLWHAVIERMGKKAFVLFCIKVIMMLVIAPVAWYIVHRFAPFSFSLAADFPALHVPLWLWILTGLLGLRGAWTTLLLKTDRSPKHRGMRLFYVFFGVGLLATVAAMRHFGGGIFLPQALDEATQWGLTDYNVAITAYAVLAAGLLVTAGIDRSLYENTGFIRALRQKL